MKLKCNYVTQMKTLPLNLNKTEKTNKTDEQEESSHQLDAWIQILRSVVPEDDSAFFEDEDDTTTTLHTALVPAATRRGRRAVDDDNDVLEAEEDSYEVAPAILQPFPENDDKKFPQESKQYFATKKYVCNDKYSLEKLLPEGLELPTLSSIYKM
jgi:hypothetical protein